ncbi:LOW QUALITY PROTEIN: hypothetical protein PHMEG_0008623 [Phytophthora megakarya]|uniref:Uncharacterized protein n=1 Tax=Phytophthora megakarya TaxID=4795 RepID=A0A225WI89_9STRA|nr:LOW QUALITY PROTEIN: hypothetical protein PHMEG_0008623 [Phytophthora megakarya]
MRYEHPRLVRIRYHLNVGCLRRPDVAPWMYIWYFRTDENVMHITSFSSGSFNELGDRFTLFYIIRIYKPKGGRPRKIKPHHQGVGVLLAFYVGSIGTKDLCTNPHTTLNRVLNDAEKAMLQALSGFGPAQIVWLTLARQTALARQTGARGLMLQFVWGFIDGKNYLLLRTATSSKRPPNAHYNGWLHGVFVMGTLSFGCDGLIVWTKHKFPGSWNDSDARRQFL